MFSHDSSHSLTTGIESLSTQLTGDSGTTISLTALLMDRSDLFQKPDILPLSSVQRAFGPGIISTRSDFEYPAAEKHRKLKSVSVNELIF